VSWHPTSSIEFLRKRADLIAKIRQFFVNRHYLEVETPYLAKYGVTDVHLSNIKAFFRDKPYYLQTSPEYHMKRLLAAGSGPIFQLARVFRDDECGRWHNPEFSLLEWYQLDVDHWYLIAEIENLFNDLCDSQPFKHLTYQEAFIEACQFDPLNGTHADIRQVCEIHDLGNVLSIDESFDQYLYLLMAMVVEPYLAKTYLEPVVVYHFPASQASLAKVENNIAHRFEVYWQGVELANGFHELTDASLQKKRFEEDLALRQSMDIPQMEMDNLLLSALESGLPACSGVALGLDRLLALILKQDSIAKVMSFAFPNL
jgi:lysyl-tRNA synthetase class 2